MDMVGSSTAIRLQRLRVVEIHQRVADGDLVEPGRATMSPATALGHLDSLEALVRVDDSDLGLADAALAGDPHRAVGRAACR
jgi:hypothetical protein